MTVEIPDGRFRLPLPLIGRHNVYNALAAVGAGVALDISLPVIGQGPGTVEPCLAGWNDYLSQLPFAVLCRLCPYG